MKILKCRLRNSMIKPRSVLLSLAALLFLQLSPAPAAAEYRAGPGDVIEISVLGIPELQRRVSVEPDGTICFPAIGSVAIGGLTLPELRASIKSMLSDRSVTLRNLDKGQGPLVLAADDVLVSVAAYRPIYIKGEVAKPGEYPFRDPMAIREALALAGGYSQPKTSAPELLLTTLDYKGELKSLWLEYAKERARFWRINAELGGNREDLDTISQSIPVDAPIDRSAISAILVQAQKQLESRNASNQTERRALDILVEQLAEEFAVTAAQVEAEEKAYAADDLELVSFGALKERGVVTSQRFADARRAVLNSSLRLLQARAKLSETKRMQTERELQRQKISADRSVALYQELEAVTARLAELRAKLQSVAEKLQVASGSRQFQGDGPKGQPAFLVHRRTAKGVDVLSETEDLELMPGDVIDVVRNTKELAQSELQPAAK